MAIFTAIAAVVTTVGTFFAAAGAIGTFVLQTAVGVGLNLLAKHIAGQQQTPEAAGPGFSVQGKLSSGGDVPRSFIMGWRVTAGSLVYANTWGEEDNGKTPNAYLTQVIALSDLPVKGLIGFWINGERREITSEGNDKGLAVEGYRRENRDHVWVRFYDGTQTAADTLCVNKVSSAERPYQATRVGVGIAYAVVTCRVNDELFSGFPQFKFEIDGVRLYDPSKDTTVGGSGPQRWADRATWGGDGDDLPAVQAYNVLRGITYDGEWLYGLQSIAGARVPVQNWTAQIAKCRAVTEGPDGDEPTYRSSAEIYVNNDIASTIEALMTACQGRLSEIGGFYKMQCGAPGSAVFSFTDDDIISTQEQSFTPFFGLSDTVNGITAKYPEPDEGWNTKAAPPIYRTNLEALAGGRRLLSDVSLDLVPYSRQVQQLMQEALQEAQRARRHTFVLPPAYWIVEPGDVGEWTSARNGYETKLFRVDGALDRGDLDVMLDLTEVDPADYDFDFEADYTPPIISPTIIVRPPAQAIVEFQAFANEVTNGVVSRPGVLLTWNGEDLDDIIGVAFEVRTADDDAVIIRGRTDNPDAGSLQIEGNGLLPATDYEVRARYIPASPRDVEWSGWLAVTTTDTRYNFADLDSGPRDYLTNQFRIEVERMKEAIQAIAAIAGAQDAFNFLDKKENRRLMRVGDDRLSASIEQVELVAVTAEQAVASLTTTVNAAISDIGEIETGLAEVASDFTAFAGPGGTFADYQVSVTASLNGISSEITTTQSAVASIDGKLLATHTLQADVNGHIVSTKFYNDGSTGGIVFSVDYLQVASSGSDPQTIFELGTVGGVIGSAILKGNFYADGFIQARHLSVESLTAITANITNLTAANINSAYATYNGGGYNGSNYNFQRQQNVSNSESRPQTPDGGTLFSKSFTTVTGRIVIFCNLSAYSNDQMVKFGNGNWGANNENYRINATLRVRNNVGTVIESISLGTSANNTAPALTGSIQLFTRVPAGETVTVDILGAFQLASLTNNGGTEVSFRWYYKVDAGNANVVIFEPYNMEAL